MANSPHTLRWLGSLRGAPFRFVLLPATAADPVAEFGPLPPIPDAAAATCLAPGQVGLWTAASYDEPDALPAPVGQPDRRFMVGPADIAAAAAALRPDLLHSMELQHAGYACLGAARLMGDDFPRWLISNWGSDLQLYQKLPEHRLLLEALLRRVDAYMGECWRDFRIARELGYRGPAFDTIPASGGIDLATLPALADLPTPSTRRDILIKGYHGWSGRALHVLSAVHLAAPALAHFRIRIILGDGPVAAMAAAIRDRDRLDIELLPFEPAHGVALARLGAARMVVSAGISDGIGTTNLEAMALGCLPVAGTSSCLDEWLRDGEGGLLVDPHDVAGLARALERAATDDALVDAAAARNRARVEQGWDARRNGAAAAAIYRALTDRGLGR